MQSNHIFAIYLWYYKFTFYHRAKLRAFIENEIQNDDVNAGYFVTDGVVLDGNGDGGGRENITFLTASAFTNFIILITDLG